MGTVDVVIPCYNYARYLRGCVRSVLSQADVSVRVLVIDDESSDETYEVGQELAASDKRVEFRRHHINKGHISTYNEGLIDWSTAEYTVLLSADDLLAPGALSRAAQVMSRHETIGMVYGRAIDFLQDSDVDKVKTSAWDGAYTRWSGADWIERRCRAGHNVISSPEVVVREAFSGRSEDTGKIFHTLVISRCGCELQRFLTSLTCAEFRRPFIAYIRRACCVVCTVEVSLICSNAKIRLTPYSKITGTYCLKPIVYGNCPTARLREKHFGTRAALMTETKLRNRTQVTYSSLPKQFIPRRARCQNTRGSVGDNG